MHQLSTNGWISAFFVRFRLCPVPLTCDILDLVDCLGVRVPNIFISKLVTGCPTGTYSRKNSATALFALNIDNLDKLAFALP